MTADEEEVFSLIAWRAVGDDEVAEGDEFTVAAFAPAVNFSLKSEVFRVRFHPFGTVDNCLAIAVAGAEGDLFLDEFHGCFAVDGL